MSWAKYEEDNRHIAQERWAVTDEHKKNGTGYFWSGYSAGNNPQQISRPANVPRHMSIVLR